jgi:hypothetical protein
MARGGGVALLVLQGATHIDAAASCAASRLSP